MTRDEKFQIGMALNKIALSLSDEDFHKVKNYLKEIENIVAKQTEPSNSEKLNNCEPKICDTCRYYDSYIPCGSTPSACEEADKFAEEFIDELKKLKSKDKLQTSKIIEAYAKGFEDGADAVKAMPQIESGLE